MDFQNTNFDTLNHITEKFTFSDVEYEKLINLRKFSIESISFTTNGGFDPESKEFHLEERSRCYKIRIVYLDKFGQKKYLFLRTQNH